MLRIIVTGGGTGGHIYPALAVMRSLRARTAQPLEIIYIGSGLEMEQDIVKESNRNYVVATGKYRRYFSLSNFFAPFGVLLGTIQSLRILFKEVPDVVFSKGGYVAFPVVLAAWMYRIPILTHETDATPGTANRIIGKFCTKVAISYRHAAQYFITKKVIPTGIPVRETLIAGDPKEGREYFHLTESMPTILVLGGSQGSRAINEKFSYVLDDVLEFSQVIHQTGKQNFDEAKKWASNKAGIKAGSGRYRIFPFLDEGEMRLALAVADLVISRAGGTAISELAANRKISILIPLESSANDHQRMNAYAVAEEGAAMVLEESNLSEHIFLEKIKHILNDEGVRDRIRERIGRFYNPKAAEMIADEVLLLATRKK
jgi:UDP-N-acetylglucosamine--N-acetylmuramyl-(pentapeptide) pyrophosphoryl-undecaprenol N-acetylglucosamine transferase